MGIPVMIEGNSGSGKSASMRNLEAARYGLVNVASKPLPFKSTKKPLNTDNYKQITNALDKAKVNLIVIDDAQYLMANEFMRRAKEKGYEKFTEIGLDFFNLIKHVVNNLPPERVVYFMGHTEIDQFGNVKFKTIGKMLDEKITIEGLFTIVFKTVIIDHKYYFSTMNDGLDTVKTPIGMFADELIDNDLALVDRTIREYYGLTA